MPVERVSMRQIREVLRLRFASELPQRAIAKSLGLSQGAVSGYLSRARAAEVSRRLAADLDDAQLDSAAVPAATGDRRGSAPDARLGLGASRTAPSQVTLALLWEEYRAGAPDGFGYSWFCDLYRGWAGRLKPTDDLAGAAGRWPHRRATSSTHRAAGGDPSVPFRNEPADLPPGRFVA
jgi:DNA-binding Lrp family transcriptional regulator